MIKPEVLDLILYQIRRIFNNQAPRKNNRKNDIFTILNFLFV